MHALRTVERYPVLYRLFVGIPVLIFVLERRRGRLPLYLENAPGRLGIPVGASHAVSLKDDFTVLYQEHLLFFDAHFNILVPDVVFGTVNAAGIPCRIDNGLSLVSSLLEVDPAHLDIHVPSAVLGRDHHLHAFMRSERNDAHLGIILILQGFQIF